jgi:hypothetical protein
MNNNLNNEQAKQTAISKIESINAVEGFDPMPLALEINNMNDGSKRYRLPVMAQMAWFRLKYPEGRIAVTVKAGKDYFIGEAKVYAHYKDPIDCYLAEGSASRGYIPDKPTVSPREWAQTAAIGIALRNAGFGLQFAVAGDSFEDNTLNEFPFMSVQETPMGENTPPAAENNAAAASNTLVETAEDDGQSVFQPEMQNNSQSGETAQPPVSSQTQPELSPLDKAMAAMCPISRYKDKTLGEMVRIDPSALAYVAKSGAKYGVEIADYAKLICDNAVQATA